MNNRNYTMTTTEYKCDNYNQIDINNNIFKSLMLLNFGITKSMNDIVLNSMNDKNKCKNKHKWNKSYKKNKWNKSFKYKYKNQLTQPRNRGMNH